CAVDRSQGASSCRPWVPPLRQWLDVQPVKARDTVRIGAKRDSARSAKSRIGRGQKRLLIERYRKAITFRFQRERMPLFRGDWRRRAGKLIPGAVYDAIEPNIACQSACTDQVIVIRGCEPHGDGCRAIQTPRNGFEAEGHLEI